MVQPAQKVGQTATQYTPVMFTAPGKKPIVISFPKGTDVDIDEKEYSLTKPHTIELDAKHYEALLKADATGDGKIDAADVKAINEKKAKAGITADKFGINVPLNAKNPEDTKKVGFFFPGYREHNGNTPGVN